ncbi:MAG: 5-(carboxyamino)imidazole ribonucleotide mutase [Deltaproteobacteria bacterium]|nr:5-(carboxyamino)imidazole ribonucleotide mutase [Candidatus Zymogenaceae bacterium]
MAHEQVLIVMGSASDLPVMQEAKKTLDELNISAQMRIASAHRTPDATDELAKAARDRGTQVIIAGAGYAAHLAGVIASKTTLPVIGVPLASSDLVGVDSLLSTVQMPPGIPVATVGIGKAGAKNAAILAAQIIAVTDESVQKALEARRAETRDSILQADKKLRETE